MTDRFFTIVCEFRGGTYVSQVQSLDLEGAVRAWTDLLNKERPIKKCSNYIAHSIANRDANDQPLALDGLFGAWCLLGTCGGDLVLMNIIESVRPTSVG